MELNTGNGIAHFIRENEVEQIWEFKGKYYRFPRDYELEWIEESFEE